MSIANDIVKRYREELELSRHPHKAIRAFTKEESIEILVHYYELCKPLKVNCSNATDQDNLNISSMAKAFNRIFEGSNVMALNISACSLPGSLARVNRYLAGIGRSSDKILA